MVLETLLQTDVGCGKKKGRENVQVTRRCYQRPRDWVQVALSETEHVVPPPDVVSETKPREMVQSRCRKQDERSGKLHRQTWYQRPKETLQAGLPYSGQENGGSYTARSGTEGDGASRAATLPETVGASTSPLQRVDGQGKLRGKLKKLHRRSKEYWTNSATCVQSKSMGSTDAATQTENLRNPVTV